MFTISYEDGVLVLGFAPWDTMYTLTISREYITLWSFDPLPGAPTGASG